MLWMQTFCPCILLFIVKCQEQKKKGGHGTHVYALGDGFAEKKRPNRQRNGKGLYIEGDYQYEGDWLDDKIHGTGIPCHLAESV